MGRSKLFSKILKKLFLGLKIALILVFFGFIGGNLYVLFFMPVENRFYMAEHLQGSYLSQTMFDIMKWQNPEFSNAYFEQSVAFNKRGEYARGFELLDKAVELDPKLHLGYRGWLKYHFLKDYNGCIEDLERLDSLTPNFVDAPWGENIHFVLGMAYKGLGDYENALSQFDKNLATEKDTSWVNANMYLYKGIIHYELKNYDKSIKNLEACLKNNYKRSAEANFYKGLIYKDLGDSIQALELLNLSKEQILKGYRNTDPYTEIQDEVYLSDVENEVFILSKNKEH